MHFSIYLIGITLQNEMRKLFREIPVCLEIKVTDDTWSFDWSFPGIGKNYTCTGWAKK